MHLMTHLRSATIEVLSTPKLLLNIFVLSAREDNASNLLVNKAWANEVMNVEWRSVDQLKQLVGLLAPLELDEDDFYIFNRPIEPTDWDRFYRYAPRVKVIIQDSDIFDDSVYEAISQTQPHDVFLPNLEHICSPIASESLSVYLYPGLSSLTLCTNDTYLTDLESIERSLSIVSHELASSLESLFFSYELEDQLLKASEGILVSTLRELRQLTALAIPPHWLSEPVTQAIASLPVLVELDSRRLEYHMGTTEFIPMFPALLDPDPFPCLQKLTISIAFEQAIPCFAS
ncbi:hypothetical protein ONZ45_g7769 [Pleurotus djamor]|nr:hypothetical protein ONZ45_g7769 [Pleurotus djamor]